MNVGTMVMEAYEAPMVEVIEVEVEKGFAQSARSIESIGDEKEEIGWRINKGKFSQKMSF